MKRNLYDALEDCLAALRSGDNLEASLSRFPDLAANLRPVLEAAILAGSLREVMIPNAALQRSRARLLAKAAELRARRQSKPLEERWFKARYPRIALSALTLTLLVFLSWQGLMVVSAKALPGDTLYPLKRVAEGLTLHLTPNIEARHEMEVNYRQRRLAEIESLLSIGRIGQVSFEGVLTQIGGERWLVENIPVVVTAQTTFIGDLQEGRVVEIEGQTAPEGWVIADEVHLRYFQIAGKVEAIAPHQWMLTTSQSIYQLTILSTTQIDPALRIGDDALALVYSGDDGALSAQAIVRLLVPQPTATPVFVPFEIDFIGVLEAVNGDVLTVAGKAVTLTDRTEVKSDFTIGDPLKVCALVGADGSLIARAIELLDTAVSGMVH